MALRQNGTLGSIPMLRGLGDERTKLLVDGMTVSSACPNHMNLRWLFYARLRFT